MAVLKSTDFYLEGITPDMLEVLVQKGNIQSRPN